jgi:hypothetical protein
VLYGGVIAGRMDCHCACTALAAFYRTEARALGSTPLIRVVTGALQVTYLKPTPIDRSVLLRARTGRADEGR